MQPLELDAHSATLLASYHGRREYLNQKLGCRMGRARVAVLSQALNGRKACDYSGRCLWGCPSKAFYTPSITLQECGQFPQFEYIPGVYADHFRMDGGGRIRSVIASTAGGQQWEFPVGSLVLAAGTLNSAKIFLESLYRESGKVPELRGGVVAGLQERIRESVNRSLLGAPVDASPVSADC